MRERKFVNGTTVEERFKSIERTFQQFFPQLGRRVEVVIPMIPIFMEKEEPGDAGIIGRCMFPLAGKIRKIHAYVNSIDKGASVQLLMEISGPTTQSFERFPLTAGINGLMKEIVVFPGTRITASVFPGNAAHGVYISMAFRLDRKFCLTETEDLPKLEFDDTSQKPKRKSKSDARE